MKRRLGRSGIEVSAMGLGCWAIGGELWEGTSAVGWGDVDDEVSVAAIREGIALGINFIDTADNYGAGHSERVVGKALKGLRDRVILATKFGNTFDETNRQLTGSDSSPKYALRECEASLKRLGTDYIDLYFFHLNDCPLEQAPAVREALEKLVGQGKIRYYGWSTDHADRAAVFAEGEHCAAIEHDENLFVDNPAVLQVCVEKDLASVNRAPLAMGILTGKYGARTAIRENDVRGSHSPPWLRYFQNGAPSPLFMRKLESVKDLLRSNGRSLSQGCLAWIWARSPLTVPIPGFRNAQQVAENARAMEYGPLSPQEIDEIGRILSAGG